MGLLSWLAEEVSEWFTSEPAVGLTGRGPDFVDPLAGTGAVGATTGSSMFADGPATPTDPVISSVNQSMNEASRIYQDAMGTNQVPSGTQSTLDFIHTVETADPEQLTRIGHQLEGSNAADDIRQSVSESQQELADSKAAHEIRMQADSAEIHAEVVSGEAEALLKKTQSEL